MNFVSSLPLVFLGLVVGFILARLHAAASRRAASSAVEGASVTRALVGFPIRVALPAAGIFGLALIGSWAVAGAMVGFALGQLRALSSSP